VRRIPSDPNQLILLLLQFVKIGCRCSAQYTIAVGKYGQCNRVYCRHCWTYNCIVWIQCVFSDTSHYTILSASAHILLQCNNLQIFKCYIKHIYYYYIDMFRKTEIFCIYRRTEELRIYLCCEINCDLNAFESTLIKCSLHWSTHNGDSIDLSVLIERKFILSTLIAGRLHLSKRNQWAK